MSIKKDFIEHIDSSLNFDIFRRKVKVKLKIVEVFFITPLIDSMILLETIRSIKEIRNDKIIQEDLVTPQIRKEIDLNKVLTSFYSGEVIIFTNNNCYIVDCRKHPLRGIDEPHSEKSIRGSRDGFNESINTNIGLIRLRIKSNKLKTEILEVSKYGRTFISLVYLEDKADLKIVEELKRRISKLDINSLIMSDRSLEERLFSQGKIIYPLVRYTERPDVASIHIMNGKIVIVVDTSPSVIITPICLLDHLKHVEEFRQTPLIGSFTKVLRIISVIVSLFLSPVVLALLTDHDYTNIFSISLDSGNSVLAFEMIVSTIILEIFRIAIVHTPTPLGGAISLVSALVLGQVSIDLGIFSSEVLLVVCISSICGFATPSYELSLSNKLVSLILLLLVAFFQMEGLLIGFILLFLYLVSIKTFNVPYLYPLVPFDFKKLFRFMFRNSNEDNKNL